MASSSSGQDGGDDPSNSSDDHSNTNRPESPAPLLYVRTNALYDYTFILIVNQEFIY